jgi:hypothetical protein
LNALAARPIAHRLIFMAAFELRCEVREKLIEFL